MAPFTTSHYFKSLTFTLLFLKTLAFDPTPLFSFADFEKDPKFKSNVELFGNAKVLNGGIQLSGFDGRIMYKRPISVLEGKSKQLVSFSTYFTFSMSLYNRGGLAFVMVPNGSKSDFFEKSSSGYPFELKNKNSRKSQVVGIEFSPSSDGRNWGHVNYNVAINVGNSFPAKISNKSMTNLVLRSDDEKLHAWIDFVASSRRLEVRLSQHGNTKPFDPFLWHSIDLTNVLKEKEFLVGFSPLKGNESQLCSVYSWSFVLRHFPHEMHSEPLDPKVLVKATETPMVKPRSDCFLRVLAAMIFGTGCGALTAFVVLYVWTIFGNQRRVVVPEEFVMETLDDAEYRKEVKIVVDKSKTIEDGKK